MKEYLKYLKTKPLKIIMLAFSITFALLSNIGVMFAINGFLLTFVFILSVMITLGLLWNSKFNIMYNNFLKLKI